jgi:hypothetical protein
MAAERGSRGLWGKLTELREDCVKDVDNNPVISLEHF